MYFLKVRVTSGGVARISQWEGSHSGDHWGSGGVAAPSRWKQGVLGNFGNFLKK